MNDYINIYNNLVKFSRNKKIFTIFTENDTFSDRLIIFLIQCGFLIQNFKSSVTKKEMQDLYDYIFRQLELSIREIGYGDASINKKMKVYINVFHSMLEKIENWDNLNSINKEEFLKSYINNDSNLNDLINYFDKYTFFLTKKSFNSFSKGVIKNDI